MTLASATRTGLSVREAGEAELRRWDALVQGFANHRLQHTRAWIESLAGCGLGAPLYLVFERDGDVVGCLPGLLSALGPWRLFGSPREGWQTVSLGPAFDPAQLSTDELVAMLVPFLRRRHGVAHVELMCSGLSPEAMRRAGFEGQPVGTMRAPLYPGDEARTFKSLKDSARRNVRRAERLGLVVRWEDDERFVDEHYDQLREVYERRGTAITFSRRRVLECFRGMRAAGCLLAPAVYLPGGPCIATGMFFIHGRELQLWMWAHREYYRWYRPTELMTWMVMRRAVAAGCDRFDLMGRGDFKAKFGASPDETKWRWLLSRPGWLAAARRLIGRGYRWQQAARGRLLRAGRLVTGHSGARRAARRAPALVLGDVDLVRTLGLAGIRSAVFAPPGDPARFSRFALARLDWLDAWDRPEEAVARLLAYAPSQPEPPVLFYQDDRALLLVSRHRERLRPAFRFVIADAELVEAAVDKGRFQQLAARLGLPVPAACPARPAAEPVHAVALSYPIVVKPLTRRNDHWLPIASGCKAIRVPTPQALAALWPRLAAADLTVLLQTFVPGPESAVESYHVYVDERGEVVAEFTGRKIRTNPPELGDSTAVEITDAADVAEQGRAAVKKLGLTGVAKLDFKRAADGRLFLLEVNPRFTLWLHAGARAGLNIPALVFGDLVGSKRPALAPARAGVRWCKAWRDRPVARAQGQALWRWLPWALGCEAKSALAWDDPLPLVGAAAWRWFGPGRSKP